MSTVTCLCLTRNRRQWLPQAIQCYQQQQYRQKQLLIVADRPEDVAGLVPAEDETIRVAYVPTTTIGEKRNLGCSMVDSDLIALHDDDDWFAPGRLSDQVVRLQETHRAATGYYSCKFTDGENWWKYLGVQQYAIGTSLLFRRTWWMDHPFRNLSVGEDNYFVAQAWSAQQLATVDGTADDVPGCTEADKMVARIHPGNTSYKNISSNWRRL